jgi:hypothetical protein
MRQLPRKVRYYESKTVSCYGPIPLLLNVFLLITALYQPPMLVHMHQHWWSIPILNQPTHP